MGIIHGLSVTNWGSDNIKYHHSFSQFGAMRILPPFYFYSPFISYKVVQALGYGQSSICGVCSAMRHQFGVSLSLLDFHVFVGSMLVHMYAKCWSIEDFTICLTESLNEMTRCTRIGAYARQGLSRDALWLFFQMIQ